MSRRRPTNGGPPGWSLGKVLTIVMDRLSGPNQLRIMLLSSVVRQLTALTGDPRPTLSCKLGKFGTSRMCVEQH